MSLPFVLPDWVPWWVPLAVLVPVLLYGLAFLFMPFSVLGVKSRLEVIEARLDDIQQEIRHLALRLPLGRAEVDFEETYAPVPPPPSKRQDGSLVARPPIPPSVRDFYADGQTADGSPLPPDALPGGRKEPRIVRPQRPEPKLDAWR